MRGDGEYAHKSLGVQSRAVHKASSVSAFICRGGRVISALMEGADRR